MAILDDIATYLQAQGLVTVATDCFEGRMPDAPDNCTALYETPGAPPSLIPGDKLDYASMQVRVRAANAAGEYQTARAKIEAIYKALHGLTETTLSGTRYHLIAAKQPPHSLGRDERQRQVFTVNFRLIYENGDR